MMAPVPLTFQWDGEAMRPLNSRAAGRQYVAGALYNLDHREDRSTKSHEHYFASVNEAFKNLRGEAATRFLSAEHLRKYALIMTGFRDERSFVAASKAEALRLAAFLRPLDEFAVVSIADNVVIMLTAKSQSYRAMGKEEFQRSKDAVLDWLAALIGTSADELRSAAA